LAVTGFALFDVFLDWTPRRSGKEVVRQYIETHKDLDGPITINLLRDIAHFIWTEKPFRTWSGSLNQVGWDRESTKSPQYIVRLPDFVYPPPTARDWFFGNNKIVSSLEARVVTLLAHCSAYAEEYIYDQRAPWMSWHANFA
jgi:hypothetical protein